VFQDLIINQTLPHPARLWAAATAFGLAVAAMGVALLFGRADLYAVCPADTLQFGRSGPASLGFLWVVPGVVGASAALVPFVLASQPKPRGGAFSIVLSPLSALCLAAMVTAWLNERQSYLGISGNGVHIKPGLMSTAEN
jgi:hypothetical protein